MSSHQSNYEFDFTNTDFGQLEQDISIIDNLDEIKLSAEDGLGEALEELNGLKQQLSEGEGAGLVDACKNSVIESITSQFGLASLVIDSKDGGSVTTNNNFKKGVTATDNDQQKYDQFKANNDGSKSWGSKNTPEGIRIKGVREEVGYDKPLAKMRKAIFKNEDVIIDAYTGKELPKDGRAHLDHVVSAKEIESRSDAHLTMTSEQRAKLATSDENLAFTAGSANQSKGEHKMEDWLNKTDKKTGGTKAERFKIDEDRALEVDKVARKHIDSNINTEKFKKYSSELVQTGAKDAANMAAYSALGAILREFTQALFGAIKEVFVDSSKRKFKEIFRTFKERLSKAVSNIKAKWKDILKGSLEAGFTAFLSNLVVFSINLFATTLKKLVSMIRAGFVSLVQAVKVIANPPEGMTKEEARYQAAKIMVAGVVGAVSLGLSAAIEKFLQAIPGLQPLMMFPIPLPGEPKTVSDLLAVTMSSILGGLLTTLIIYLMDKLRGRSKKDKLHIQMVYKSGVVVEYSTMLSWLSLEGAFKQFFQDANQQLALATETKIQIQSSNEGVAAASSSYSQMLKKFKNRRN